MSLGSESFSAVPDGRTQPSVKLYALTLLFPPVMLLGFEAGGLWMFFFPLFAFGLVPLVELFAPGTSANFDAEAEARAKTTRSYDFVLYGLVLLQWGLVLYMLQRLGTQTNTPLELVGLISSVGLTSGVFGINVGHELGHRKKRYEQNLAKLSLLSTLYTHFFIEHNRGHHARVATPEDPASARRGEMVYTFWCRSVAGSWLSAWHLEARRLRKRGRRVLSWHNQMLRLQLLQLALLVAVYAVFGLAAVLGFLATSAIGILLLETVNYLEHYGLQRQRTHTGRYEGVKPQHAWNSNRPWSRVLLFELTRHADHHVNANRKYQILRHVDPSPQLPTGYAGMILLALIPPLWFRVMHRILDRQSRPASV